MSQSPASNPALSGRQILVADADSAWQAALRRRLTELGAVVFQVHSAQEAAASAASRHFDAVLLSSESDEAAKSAAQRLRALPADGAGPALIGVFAGAAAAQMAEDAGLDGFLRRSDALLTAPLVIALLTRRVLVQPAEFDQIEQEDRGDENDDRNKHGHLGPQNDKMSGAL